VGLTRALRESIHVLKDSKIISKVLFASANVKQLLETAPTLQHDITETNKTVFELKGGMEALKTVPQQIQTIQQDLGKVQIQTNNIQKQIHTIPGVKP
jgi:heme oxygenase